jgi:hypothetical protein
MRRFSALKRVALVLVALTAATNAADAIDPPSSTLPTAVREKYQTLFPGQRIWQVAETGKGKDAKYELTVFDPNSTGVHGIQVGPAHVTTLLNYKLVLTATGEVILEQAHPIAEGAVPRAVKDAMAGWIGRRLGRATPGSRFVEWMAHQEEGAERLFQVRIILSSVEGYTATFKADGTVVKKSGGKKARPKAKDVQGVSGAER